MKKEWIKKAREEIDATEKILEILNPFDKERTDKILSHVKMASDEENKNKKFESDKKIIEANASNIPSPFNGGGVNIR